MFQAEKHNGIEALAAVVDCNNYHFPTSSAVVVAAVAVAAAVAVVCLVEEFPAS